MLLNKEENAHLKEFCQADPLATSQAFRLGRELLMLHAKLKALFNFKYDRIFKPTLDIN